MKTSELIKVLEDKLTTHGDLSVEVTYEGITQSISASDIYVYGDLTKKNMSLYINAEYR